MSDKFLGSGSNVNLSNGTAVLFGASIGAINLDPSQPLKTNSVRQLISSKLDIADVNNLQTELNKIPVQNRQIELLPRCSIRDSPHINNTGTTYFPYVATNTFASGTITTATIIRADPSNSPKNVRIAIYDGYSTTASGALLSQTNMIGIVNGVNTFNFLTPFTLTVNEIYTIAYTSADHSYQVAGQNSSIFDTFFTYETNTNFAGGFPSTKEIGGGATALRIYIQLTSVVV